MAVALHHIIIPAADTSAAARLLATVLGMETGPGWGPPRPIRLANDVTLGFTAAHGGEAPRCAFVVSRAEFDAIVRRLTSSDVTYYADPFGRRHDELRVLASGRSLFVPDPDGWWIEILSDERNQPNAGPIALRR